MIIEKVKKGYNFKQQDSEQNKDTDDIKKTQRKQQEHQRKQNF